MNFHPQLISFFQKHNLYDKEMFDFAKEEISSLTKEKEAIEKKRKIHPLETVTEE